jgi:hypothetical protein
MLHSISVTDESIAIINLLGLTLDALGGLFLAYDLLGGEHGPLRIIMRVITYGAIFAVGYTIFLGVTVGVVLGALMAVLLGYEFTRAAASEESKFVTDTAFAVCRGFAIGSAVALKIGIKAGALYSVLSALTLFLTYWLAWIST